jgi:DNA repair protein RadC
MPGETARRIKEVGLGGALPMELLAYAVSKTDEEADRWLPVARELMLASRNLRKLADISSGELQTRFEVDEEQARRLMAMFTLGRKVGVAGTGDSQIETIDGPEDVAALLDDLRTERQEHFVAIFLDAKSVILRIATIHIGTANSSQVGAREIFREAVREGALSVIVAHNHPSGDPTPSPEDIATTKHLVQVGKMLEIPVLDHVIIGERRWVSLKRQNLL